jgi:phosphoadenosine phosphosulfate reductase
MNTGLDIARLNEQLATASAEEVLRHFLTRFAGRIALSSSLSLEDQMLTDMIARLDPATRVFTLDTGRLFPETYRLIDRTNKRYGITIDLFFPDHTRVEEMVRKEGINLFYDSVEKRKRCCQVRKLEPLRRAFRGLEAWICGLRREQSVTRQEMQLVEWDEVNQLVKINPLIDWSEEAVRTYIVEHNVPYNKLHDEGYSSIGCEPCTRAVEPGDDPRAGRWWWESPLHKECGLHRR